jgi:hypothetical protein
VDGCFLPRAALINFDGVVDHGALALRGAFEAKTRSPLEQISPFLALYYI